MTRYVVVRVWLADRPGSLGRLASRIGELGGDLVGIDILERDGTRAVDELTVELPEGSSPDDLTGALSELPGVEVEDLRHLLSKTPDNGRDPLGAAVAVAEARSRPELLEALIGGVRTAFACDWACALEVGGPAAASLASSGSPPTAAWLAAFVEGARAGVELSSVEGLGLVGPRDVAWAPFGPEGMVVLAGRDGPPFRGRERRQLQQLCRIGAARWGEIAPAAPAG